MAAKLRDVAFIPVYHNSRLAAPRNTFLRLRRSLQPFAFELHAVYTQYANLLSALGCRDEPSPVDFLEIYQVSCSQSTLYSTLFCFWRSFLQ